MKRAIPILLALVLLLGPASAIPAKAQADAVDQFAMDYLDAVNSRQTQVTLFLETTDISGFLVQAFTRYPVLYYYYAGYSGSTSGNTATITFKLNRPDVPVNEVFVIKNDAELKALIGYGLSNLTQELHFVAVNGFATDGQKIADLAAQIKHEQYLAYMGYHGNSITYSTWDEAPIARYVLTLRYWEGLSLQELARWRNETERSAVNLATTLFAQDMPDYMKELRIHDWLVNNNRYNTVTPDAPASHMAYGALVTGTPVCQAYAEAMLVLCQAAGIPCMYVSGTGTNSSGKTESHGWNCVQIQGKWYWIDVTWDDPTTHDGSNALRYTYFNVTTDYLARDHQWDQSPTPYCNSYDMNDAVVQDLCASDQRVYTQYSAEKLVTQEEARQYFGQAVQALAPLLPQDNIPQPTEPPVQPPETQPEYEPPVTAPSQEESRPQVTLPQSSRPTPYNPPQNPGGNGQDGGGSALPAILAVVLLLGAGCVVVVFVLKNRRSAPKRTTFNSSDPFAGGGFGAGGSSFDPFSSTPPDRKTGKSGKNNRGGPPTNPFA